MTDDRNNLSVIGSNSGAHLGVNPLQSHIDDCQDEDCELCRVIATYSEVTSAQVKVGLATAISGLVVSSAFAFGILWVWIHHALQGHPMPPIPFIIASIVDAAFLAGTITVFRLPRKAKLRIEHGN